MANYNYPFQPEKTTIVTTSATSTTVAFVTQATVFRLVNRTAAVAHWVVGGATISASTTDFVMLASSERIFRRNPLTDTHISIRNATGAGTASVEEGSGGI